ncbi:MAG: PilZ domain-containing protein [Endomicrobiaceae bacterium]|nr:PilZ domain-containing protein [Endomicrobiaceae bacterium]
MLNKRRHHRFPVIKDFGHAVSIGTEKETFPGIIINLSAGGMLLLMYSDMPIKKEVSLMINIPKMETKPISGEVIRSKLKNSMWEIGIEFRNIDTLDSKKINRMAIDFTDCETKITLGAIDICKKECSYYVLCDKKQKI